MNDLVYGYFPPQRGKNPPATKNPEGWLVIFVAPFLGTGKLIPVGWYRDAHLKRTWSNRPGDVGLDRVGRPYSYNVTARAEDAVLLPESDRKGPQIPGNRFARTPFMYLCGPFTERWKRDLAEELLELADSYSSPASPATGETAEEWNIDAITFPDEPNRKEIETNAVNAVRRQLDHEYTIKDRQKDNCGYDLQAINKSDQSGELHIEVKGTARARARFFLSRNEYAYCNEHDPRWRLGMVTLALDPQPHVEILNRRDVRKRFALDPFCWMGIEKPED